MFSFMSYNRIRTLELIKKRLCDSNVGKNKEHKSKPVMSGVYIHKIKDDYEFGHPSSGGPLLRHDIGREMKK